MQTKLHKGREQGSFVRLNLPSACIVSGIYFYETKKGGGKNRNASCLRIKGIGIMSGGESFATLEILDSSLDSKIT